MIHDSVEQYISPTQQSIPQPILDRLAVSYQVDSIIGNTFCPTGEGGGVDPTCSPQSDIPRLPLSTGQRKWYGRLERMRDLPESVQIDDAISPVQTDRHTVQ